jgi:hypothetical protein
LRMDAGCFGALSGFLAGSDAGCGKRTGSFILEGLHGLS